MTNLSENMIESVALNITNILCASQVDGKFMAEPTLRDEIQRTIAAELADTDFNDYE